MTTHRRRALAALATVPAGAALASLQGCVPLLLAHQVKAASVAAAEARGVKPANFKLTAAHVLWMDPPAIPYEIEYKTSRYAIDKNPTQLEQQTGRDYIDALLALYRANGPSCATQELASAGVPDGTPYLIVLTPTRGAVSVVGGHCTMTVRVAIRGARGQELQAMEVDSRSGWQPQGSPKEPELLVVRNFAKAMVKGFRDATLIA